MVRSAHLIEVEIDAGLDADAAFLEGRLLPIDLGGKGSATSVGRSGETTHNVVDHPSELLELLSIDTRQQLRRTQHLPTPSRETNPPCLRSRLPPCSTSSTRHPAP